MRWTTRPIPRRCNYRGYRKSICTSINHVVCHGIPDDKPLRDGDILNIDVTLIVEGWHGDSSRMYVAGEAPRRAQRLIDVTYEALMRGIAAVKPGATTGDIGAAIQSYAEPERCSVVRDFCGHGLGRLFHDEPNILHYGRRGEGVPLRAGMFFTIEPMINLGLPGVKVLSDGWTAVTRDRSLVGAVRTYGRRDGDRRRNIHLVAARLGSSALSRFMSERGRRDRSAAPLSSAIASGCARGCARPAPMRSPITNCSNSCCSARSRGATSSRSPRR